jgi:mono/diheme cytochrome c family protein
MRAVLAAATLIPLQAHDVITTAVTWDREISRVVYARCASCHHTGGTAFTLMTYQAARPWAAAIKDAVLHRRMPPWGAVKGFGDFRNDQALTSEELQFVTSWSEGGAPEGDPKDLPPAPSSWESPAPPDLRGALPVSGALKLTHALVLDGLLPQNVPPHASFKILAQLPDGSLQPLLWLQDYDSRYPHTFLLRNPLSLPALTVIHGVPEGTRIMLIPAGPAPRAPAAR